MDQTSTASSWKCVPACDLFDLDYNCVRFRKRNVMVGFPKAYLSVLSTLGKDTDRRTTRILKSFVGCPVSTPSSPQAAVLGETLRTGWRVDYRRRHLTEQVCSLLHPQLRPGCPGGTARDGSLQHARGYRSRCLRSAARGFPGPERCPSPSAEPRA